MSSLRKTFFLHFLLIVSCFSIFLFMIELQMNASTTNSSAIVRFDHYRMLTRVNYPVCTKIAELRNEQIQEELHLNENVKKYKDNITNGDLYCGSLRVWGKWFTRTTAPLDCSGGLTRAKSILLDFISDVCQDHGEIFTKIASNSFTIPTEADILSKGLDVTLRHLVVNPDLYANYRVMRTERRGIIFTGAIKHIRQAYTSIYGLHLLGNRLPIEMWVNPGINFRVCQQILGFLATKLSRDDIHCRNMSYPVNGYVSKFHALLQTTLTDVIFLDADNLPVGNLSAIFDHPEYRRTGMVLWPDLWGEKCRNTFSETDKRDFGYTAQSNYLFSKARLGGFKWHPTREYAQEAEAGQLVIDLRRHAGLLNIGRRFLEDPFLGRTVYGDKDVFRLIFLLMEAPFYFVPQFPAYSVVVNELETSAFKKDSIVQFFSDSSTTDNPTFVPHFFHQLKLRSPEAFRNLLRVDSNDERAPSACLGDWQLNPNLSNEPSSPIQHGLNNLHIEKLIEGDRLAIYARQVFEKVEQDSNDSALRPRLEEMFVALLHKIIP